MSELAAYGKQEIVVVRDALMRALPQSAVIMRVANRVGAKKDLLPGKTMIDKLDHSHMTMVTSMGTVSKSRFKAHALELFRQVEQTGKALIITDRGIPVLKLIPYQDDPEKTLKFLRETVVKYTAPTKPVGEDDWSAR